MSTNGSTQSCHYFASNHCRSCALLALPYEEQLQRKRARLLELFKDGFSSAISIAPIVPVTQPLPSRAKAKMAVGGRKGEVQIGFSDGAGTVRALSECPLHRAPINSLLASVVTLLNQLEVTPYSVTDRSGELKFIIVKACEGSNNVLLRLVSRSTEQLSLYQRLAESICTLFPEVKVVSLNIQPEHKAVLEGEEEIILTKSRWVCESFGAQQLYYTAKSFSQVTPEIAEKLYRFVASEIAAHQVSTLLDLYCGVGGFLIFSAGAVKEGIGIELSDEAIEAARYAATMQGLTNLSFLAADVDAGLPCHSFSPDALIVNPPRRGLSPILIDAIMRSAPRLILYSSCKPETLKRDLLMLEHHYRVKTLQPFDMFPLTQHLETVAVLERIV